MQDEGRNLNPVIYKVTNDQRLMAARLQQELNTEIEDDIDALEICPWALREGIVLKWLDWMEK